MLLKGQRRLGLFATLIVALFLVLLRFLNHDQPDVSARLNRWLEQLGSWNENGMKTDSLQRQPDLSLIDHNVSDADLAWREVFSPSTEDGSYFLIEFGDQQAINPNIIPHPFLDNTWIIVAQQQKSSVKTSVWFAELVCNAVFQKNILHCVEPPMILPIAATSGHNCEGDVDYFTLNIGPHDARVFYGPKVPYVLYGSNSVYTCFGQWMQDLRVLVDWGFEMFVEEKFRKGTELLRPPPYQPIEKNWFVFWDKYEQIYVHYDIAPSRSFAKLEYDGLVGPDLAAFAFLSDERCMKEYMPLVSLELESIHQATNSLSITLCRRSDPSCKPNDLNTFVFTIFQHKSFFDFHSVYEPYIMLFQQEAPFEIYAISRKPIWIRGRRTLEQSYFFAPAKGKQMPRNQTELFYVTSMNWKKQGQKYHGYLDDALFIAFGIEDKKTAGIDVVAGDLFQDLAFCSTTWF